MKNNFALLQKIVRGFEKVHYFFHVLCHAIILHTKKVKTKLCHQYNSDFTGISAISYTG